MISTEWMMLEVLVPVQGHCLTFPPSGARLATLLCQGGGGGGKEWVLLELVRGRWTGSLGDHLAERGPGSHLGHVTATIQGI